MKTKGQDKDSNNGSCDCCEGVEIQTPLPTANRPGLPALSYRMGTHASFLQSMQARLASRKLPELAKLTTRDSDDLSMALLDAWAAVADVLTFYQERIANEGYLRTATEQKSIEELGRLVGHRPQPGISASTYLAYTVDENRPEEEITIPAGSKVQSVPGPGEKAQTFESSVDLKARAQWNNLAPRLHRQQTFLLHDKNDPNVSIVYLKGIQTNLKLNDRLLLEVIKDKEIQPVGEDLEVKPVKPELYHVTGVEPDENAQSTCVKLLPEKDPFEKNIIEDYIISPDVISLKSVRNEFSLVTEGETWNISLHVDSKKSLKKNNYILIEVKSKNGNNEKPILEQYKIQEVTTDVDNSYVSVTINNIENETYEEEREIVKVYVASKCYSEQLSYAILRQKIITKDKKTHSQSIIHLSDNKNLKQNDQFLVTVRIDKENKEVRYRITGSGQADSTLIEVKPVSRISSIFKVNRNEKLKPIKIPSEQSINVDFPDTTILINKDESLEINDRIQIKAGGVINFYRVIGTKQEANTDNIIISLLEEKKIKKIYAFRTKTAPFGHNAPLRPVGMDINNVMRHSEWDINEPINNAEINISFDTNQTPAGDGKINLTVKNTSSGVIESVVWEFKLLGPDGNMHRSNVFSKKDKEFYRYSKIYKKGDTIEIRLLAPKLVGHREATDTVVLSPPPIINFEAELQDALNVFFKNISKNYKTISWNFSVPEDQITVINQDDLGNKQEIKVTYATEGKYEVILSGNGTAGIAKCSKEIIVVRKPQADFEYSVKENENGKFEVVCRNTSTSKFIQATKWIFRKENTSINLLNEPDKLSQEITNLEEGKYKAILVLTNPRGKSKPKQKTIVLANALRASFNEDHRTTLDGPPKTVKIFFKSQSIGNISKAKWYFGYKNNDGTNAEKEIPSVLENHIDIEHIYKKEGKYFVILEIINNEGDISIYHQQVNIDPSEFS